MRCQYCHNPDTWKLDGGTEKTVEEILSAYDKNKNFYKNGGITATGGEPLLQLPFLTCLFQHAKEKGIHTCLDTSGIAYRPDASPDWLARLDRLMGLTDLVMLDIKHIDPGKHRKLTGQPNDGILAFCRYLNEKKVKMWVRHVVVPTITDDPEYLYRLGYFIGQFPNLKALDILPYHTMGKVKYDSLGIDYPLKDIPAMDSKRAIELKKSVLEGIRDRRMELNMLGRGI